MRGLKKYVESNKERLLKAAGVKWEGIVGAGKIKKEVLEARNKRKSHYIHSLWGKQMKWEGKKLGTG